MGAWGEGMQGNDTALDGIGAAGLSDGEPKKQAKTLKELRSGQKTVASLFKGDRWIKKEPQAILGLAEYLFDEGFDLQPVRDLVNKALKEELSKERLDCWVDRDERKAALLRFRDRLAGKKVPQELIDKDNEGLLSKIMSMPSPSKRWKSGV